METLDYSAKWPYRKCQTLLNEDEEHAYFILREALPEYLIFPQVQLARILDVERNHSLSAWIGVIERFKVDFVVCNQATEVVALIELDDSSHDTEERRQADRKKDKACADAGLPITRWRKVPEKDEIRKVLGL